LYHSHFTWEPERSEANTTCALKAWF